MFTRFFRYHTSFYELEILNKSIIKSYVVLLEANVYQKAVDYLYDVQDELNGDKDVVEDDAEEKEDNKEPAQSKEKPDEKPEIEEKEPASLTVREHVIRPLRKSVLEKLPSSAFGSYKTIPISLSAVASQIKVPVTKVEFDKGGPFGFGPPGSSQKAGKKNKKGK
jgi:hypothetical protein